MKKILFITIAWILFPLSTAFAVKVTSLYEAEVPVMSQSDQDKEQAEKRGLMEVLVKLSGNADIKNNSVIQAGLQTANQYVQEFSYTGSSTSSTPYIIQIRYDNDAVDQLLKQANVPYWGANRPLILVWLAVTNEQGGVDIMGDETSTLVHDIVKQGKQYGLPLIFPVMDMTDMGQVSPETVTQMAVPVLQQAGKRYGPDALLIGQIQGHAGDFQSHWQLVLGDNQWTWTVQDQSTDKLIASVLNQANQALAKRYVVKSEEVAVTSIHVKVSPITSRADLVKLMQYLKQLTPVQQVQLLQINGDEVELTVDVQGSLATFQQNVAISQHLISKTGASTEASTDTLIYEWVN